MKANPNILKNLALRADQSTFKSMALELFEQSNKVDFSRIKVSKSPSTLISSMF